MEVLPHVGYLMSHFHQVIAIFWNGTQPYTPFFIHHFHHYLQSPNSVVNATHIRSTQLSILNDYMMEIVPANFSIQLLLLVGKIDLISITFILYYQCKDVQLVFTECGVMSFS